MENNKNSNLPKKDGRLFVYLKVKKPLEKDKIYYNISEDKKLLSLHDKIIKDESSKTQIIEVDRIYDDSDDENINPVNDSARMSNKIILNNNFPFNNKKINQNNGLNNISKNTPDTSFNNYNRVENNNNNKIKNNKELKMKIGKNSFKFNFFNNLSTNGNKHYYKTKLYSMKGMINGKKINKNISNSNQNLLSNTMFELNNKYQNNNINFYENYIKAVALNKANKYSINKSKK